MEDFLHTLRRKNVERTEEWCKGEEMDILYASNEFAGEAGEVCNKIKKLVREERGWVGSRTTLGELAEEIADVLICLDSIANILGIDIAQVVKVKFDMTSAANGLSTRFEA